MKLRDVIDLLECRIISGQELLERPVKMACGADLMSDVLAFTHSGTLLLTGLTNPQVVRTAEMAGIDAIVFVRGKIPPPATIALAQEDEIPLLATLCTLYEASGRLYGAGIPSCGTFDLSRQTWQSDSD